MKVFACHDKKAKAFTSVHAASGSVQATRDFVQAVLTPNSVFSKYPEDFELVCLGSVVSEYESVQDYQDGVLVPLLLGYEVVITAEQILASQPKAAVDPSQLQLSKEA